MRTATKLTLLALLTALTCATSVAADDQAVPCQVLMTDQTSCPADPQAVARWTQKRLKELDEQAATARLNRESNRQTNQETKQAPPIPVPPSRQAANLAPAPTMAPAQYRSALEEYQALREAYDRQLRAYYRAFPAQVSVNAPPPASAAPLPAEHAAQDAARADAWHGYDRHNGLGNGY